jgi:hypothetical protein
MNQPGGCVYAMDIQNDALENTSLLEESLNPNEVPLSHSSIYIYIYILVCLLLSKQSRKLYSCYLGDVSLIIVDNAFTILSNMLWFTIFLTLIKM